MSAANANSILVKKLVAMCVAMFLFGFALVPLYDVFCRYTGINGKTAKVAAIASGKIDKTRLIEVEFIATNTQQFPLRFAAEVDRISLHPGEMKIVNFVAENLSEQFIVAQAVPSVSPGQYAEYFKKIECFCFVQQPLAAHESKQMPVQFYLDRALPTEARRITLSYRMYQVQSTQAQAM